MFLNIQKDRYAYKKSSLFQGSKQGVEREVKNKLSGTKHKFAR